MVLALHVLDVVHLVRLLQQVLEGLLPVLGRRQDAVPLQECLLEIFALELLQVEIGFEAVVQFLLLGE